MRPMHLLLLVIFLGTFLRFFALQQIPPGLYPDEAMNGVDALRALDRSDFKVFYPNNNGREGLFINLQALSVQMFGATPWALRAVGAAVGSLTLIFFYLLALEIGRRLFPKKENSEKHWPPYAVFALLATFLLASSAWHIHFSRMGFRAIMLPLLSSAAIYYLLRGLRSNKSHDLAFSGAFFGLSFYTYIASRVLPLVAIVLFAADTLQSRGVRQAFFRRWLVFIAAFFFVVTPLAGYFIAHPQDFVGRAGSVSIFAAENPGLAFLESLGRTLLMFNVRGDGNWRHNAAGSPELDPITGLFFLLGAALMARGLFRPGERVVWGTIALWFTALLLPVVTTAEGVPHALRAIGVIPPVFLIAAAGGTYIWTLIRHKLPFEVAQALMLLAFAVVLLMNTQKYFLVWAGNENVPGAYRQDLVDLAGYLNDHKDKTRYVIVNENGTPLDGVPMPSATIRFLTQDDQSVHYLAEESASDITPDYDRTLIIVTSPPSENLDNELRSLFPSIEREDQNGMFLYKL